MNAVRDDIAVVGMSCLFPGAPNVDAYWRNILGKVDAVSDPPAQAWDVDTYYDPEFVDTDKVYCKRGGYLGELATFDPLAYGIPPVTVGGEPDQWLALRLAHEALMDARALTLPPEVRARTGIVLGKGTYLNGGNAVAVQRVLIVEQTLALLRDVAPDHTDEQLDRVRDAMKAALPTIGPETVAGLIPNIVVGRIANRLDLMGPAYTVDAACASSLVAVQLAQRHLLNGECDLMLAGGSQVWMPVPTLNVFSHLGALSRRQQIRPFDRTADGTLLGEGIGFVVLKRAGDARRDGDRVYAVIKGVGVASDGRGASVMAPRVEGEEAALRRAYDDAGVDPRTVELIEAHGTATPVGDAAEIEALRRVFGDRDGALPPCALGSVKSMISHTIPASGVAGLIKVALALHHRVLPPTLHCEDPNLDLDASRFYINTEVRPWVHGGPEPRRAGVNAFGFGGINAHVVLEEVVLDDIADHLPPWDSEVVLLEAPDAAALAARASDLATRLDLRTDVSLVDVAAQHAQDLGSAEHGVRLAIVATSLDDLRTKLCKAADRLAANPQRIKGVSGIYYEAEPLGRKGPVVLLFPGEGSQYPDMLKDICLHFPEAREAFDEVDRIYHDHPRGHLSSDWVFPRPAFSDSERRTAEARLVQMDIAVEAVLTANQAMFAVLSRLGVQWDACLGHSTGEFSAAKAAGVLALDDHECRTAFSEGLYACYAAASARDDVPRAVLLAVGAGRERVESLARESGDFVVAMDNCPHQVVLVGDPARADAVRDRLAQEGLVYEELPYDRAVHTPQFDAFADSLRSVFEGMEVTSPKSTLLSCTTMAAYPDEPDDIRGLLVEHWTSPVEFTRTIQALHEQGARVFVECGPRGNLTAFVDDILRGRDVCAVAANVQRRSGITQLNHLVATLAVHHVGVDVAQLFVGRARGMDWDHPDDAPGHVPAKAPVDLSISWPMLRVDPKRIAPRAEGRLAVPAEASEDEVCENGDRGRNSKAGDSESASLPVTGTPVTKNGSNGSVAPNRSELVDGIRAEPAATSLMADHFDRMTRFLTAHGDVTRAFIARSAPRARPPTAHPLLGAPSQFVAGEQVRWRRSIDLDVDQYLDDHRLGGVLAVMPLAMTMAMMAEAARALAPGAVVVGMRDVVAHQWLMVEDSPRTIEIVATRQPDMPGLAVAVEVRDVAGSNGQATVGGRVANGVVLLAAAPATPPTEVLELQRARTSTLDPSRLYRDVMFHGPRWQAVRALSGSSRDGLRAELDVLELDSSFESPNARLAIDPVILDAAGQLVGFWTAEHLERGQIVFPYRLARLDLYGPRRPAGEVVTGTAVMELVGDDIVRSDIDVVARDGGVWLSLRGWEDRRFDLPRSLAGLMSGALPSSFSSPAPASVARATLAHRAECRRLVVPSGAGRAVWSRVWSRRVFGADERHRIDVAQVPESRKAERLAARTAAKEAVRQLMHRCGALELELNEIDIDEDDKGRPVVRGSWCRKPAEAPHVSLAHAGGTAIAMVSLDGPVGIDIEPKEPVPQTVIDTAFEPADIEIIRSAAGDDVSSWFVRCWCAKEAVAKAAGTGFIRSPREVRIEAVDIPTGVVTARLTAALLAGGREIVPECLQVETFEEEDMIVAITWCEKAGVHNG
jgi:acyl transferase domain-containing protein/phosphopantetheinyl transferase